MIFGDFPDFSLFRGFLCYGAINLLRKREKINRPCCQLTQPVKKLPKIEKRDKNEEKKRKKSEKGIKTVIFFKLQSVV